MGECCEKGMMRKSEVTARRMNMRYIAIRVSDFDGYIIHVHCTTNS